MTARETPEALALPPGVDGARVARVQAAIGERYTLLAFIGRGATASVFKARNLKLDRVEALKILSPECDHSQESAKRFLNEAQVAASLDHPNIVTIHDFGNAEGILWYSMRLIEGRTLQSLLDDRGPLDKATTIRLALPLLDALEYSHRRGVVHRDIKPSNIMLDGEGAPSLVDFGIAKTPENILKTRTGVLLGTPAYVAPEQVSTGIIDARADLYSLGVTLYQMLAGAFPFSGTTVLATVVKRLTYAPEPLSEKRPGLDPRLVAIVMHALERRPERRWGSAREMREALIAIASETSAPSGAPSLPTGSPLARQSGGRRTDADATMRVMATRRAPLRHVGLLVVASMLAAGTIGLVLLRGGATRQPVPVKEASAPFAVATHPPHGSTAEPTAAPEVRTPGTGTAAMRANPTAPADHSQGAVPSRGPTASEARTLQAEAASRPVTYPELMEQAPRAMPAALAELCRGQTVNLSLLITADGRVARARVLSAEKKECGEAAVALVRGDRYRPAADAAGRPLETTIAVAVPF